MTFNRKARSVLILSALLAAALFPAFLMGAYDIKAGRPFRFFGKK